MTTGDVLNVGDPVGSGLTKAIDGTVSTTTSEWAAGSVTTIAASLALNSGTLAAGTIPGASIAAALTTEKVVLYGSTGPIPTSDPAIVGHIWSNSGTITISAG